jgi:DNA-binding protein HU-beta
MMGPARLPERVNAVNKSELIDIVAERLNLSKKAAGDVVEAVIDEITRSVSSGEKVSISGFGVFEKQDRAARVGRNPRTGAAVKIKATSVPKFRAGADFKLVVAGKKRPAAAKKTTAKKAAPAKKAAAKKAPAKKAAPAKRVAKAAPARTTVARKASAKKAAPAKRAVKTATPARKAPAKRPAAKKAPAKRAAKR